MAQVVEGEFWFAPDGQPERIFKAGEALTVRDRAIHNEGATDKGVSSMRYIWSRRANRCRRRRIVGIGRTP